MLQAAPTVDNVRDALNRVLASRGFARNERLSRFLRYVVEGYLEGKSAELKESVLAIEVFGRKPDTTRQDSIVRTEATRLRARLAEYYGDEGRHDPLIIELPKGGYTPRFHPAEVVEPARPGISRWPKVMLAMLLAAAGACALWWWIARPAPFVIAVLPLSSLSPDASDEYIADGLTDEIIRNLSLIEGLAVRSRISSFAFKGKPRNLRDIGAQLDAAYILDGSVFRDGQKLRVDAELVRVRDNVLVWSSRFDRDIANLFSIQDEISRSIVNSLRLKFGRGRRHYETSPEAYELYLRALQMGSFGALQKQRQQAVALYNAVISRDTAFAPAYAGLAGVYASMLFEFLADPTLVDPGEAQQPMRAAAEKAIELDPLLPEAYDAMGFINAQDHQWAGAERNLRHALELDANRSATYLHYAYNLLIPLGRIGEAIQQLQAAQRADPLSPQVHHVLGVALICAGRYEEAAAHCERAQRIDPKYFRARQHLARALLFQGRTAEAIQMFEKFRGNSGYLGFAYARAGRRADAEKLAIAEAGHPQREVLIHAGLGDKDRAFEALDRMAASGDGRTLAYLAFPELAALRTDPRMKAFRRKLALPQ
jgi:TolB-like protein